jgi:hypothetical protein
MKLPLVSRADLLKFAAALGPENLDEVAEIAGYERVSTPEQREIPTREDILTGEALAQNKHVESV